MEVILRRVDVDAIAPVTLPQIPGSGFVRRTRSRGQRIVKDLHEVIERTRNQKRVNKFINTITSYTFTA